MYQNLTKRLTKPVSFFATLLLFGSLSLAVMAQGESEEASDNTAPEVQDAAQNDASTEDLNALADEAVNDEAVEPLADESKLEEIDEADVTYQDEGTDVAEGEEQSETATPLSEEVEDLKKAALELNRDLLILEEELLFPANSQIVVFVSLDVGEYFALDSVKLLIDDKLVASHLYTRRQNSALALGGIQRLYLGNLKSGEHELTAFFVGVGPNNREYKRGATVIIDKDDDPKLLELKVRDSTKNMQPEFEFEEWQL